MVERVDPLWTQQPITNGKGLPTPFIQQQWNKLVGLVYEILAAQTAAAAAQTSADTAQTTAEAADAAADAAQADVDALEAIVGCGGISCVVQPAGNLTTDDANKILMNGA